MVEQLMQQAAGYQPPLVVSTEWARPSSFCSGRVEYLSAPGEPGLPRCSECFRLLTSRERGCQVHGVDGIDAVARQKWGLG